MRRFTERNIIRFTYFGLWFIDINNNHKFFCGSPIFMNLDRLTGNYKSNSDFWAIKVIYYYMVYGNHPYEGATNIKELIKTMDTKGDSFPIKFLKDAIKKGSDFAHDFWEATKREGTETKIAILILRKASDTFMMNVFILNFILSFHKNK